MNTTAHQAFVLSIARTPLPDVRVELGTLSGGPGVLVHVGERLDVTLALAVDDQRRITGVYLVRNPDKLVTRTPRR